MEVSGDDILVQCVDEFSRGIHAERRLVSSKLRDVSIFYHVVREYSP